MINKTCKVPLSKHIHLHINSICVYPFKSCRFINVNLTVFKIDFFSLIKGFVVKNFLVVNFILTSMYTNLFLQF